MSIHSVVVDGPLALRMQRLDAAREGATGRQILTLPLLAARLAARGRETPQSIAERLQREGAFAGRLRADCVIVNDRPVAETGAALVAHLEGVAKEAALSAAASP